MSNVWPTASWQSTKICLCREISGASGRRKIPEARTQRLHVRSTRPVPRPCSPAPSVCHFSQDRRRRADHDVGKSVKKNRIHRRTLGGSTPALPFRPSIRRGVVDQTTRHSRPRSRQPSSTESAPLAVTTSTSPGVGVRRSTRKSRPPPRHSRTVADHDVAERGKKKKKDL